MAFLPGSHVTKVYRMFSTRIKRTVERDRVRASLTPYWSRPCEIFSRLVDHWFATMLLQRCAAAVSPEAYENRAGYLAEDDFDELMRVAGDLTPLDGIAARRSHVQCPAR